MARILVIEDYESLQLIYKTVLEQAGHRVEVVNDGFAALEKANRDSYDLILVDLLLPHMSGMEFLRAFNPAKHPKTKIVICSNFTSAKFIQEAEELGVAHHVTKSNLSPRELAMVVDNTLKEP